MYNFVRLKGMLPGIQISKISTDGCRIQIGHQSKHLFHSVVKFMIAYGNHIIFHLIHYIYDIFSGKHIGILGGGGDKAWNIYYDIQNDRYIPIGRYDLRSGDSGSSHHISTIQYSEEDQLYYGKTLFYSSYEYDKIITEGEDGKIGSIELDIEDVDFMVNGEPIGFQSYHYELTDFYQEHSLVPHTGLMLYYWSDVSDDDDSYQERAEKMAQMLLFGSGQKFVKINN